MFSLDGNVADNEPYKALAELARAANQWSQCKRNLPADSSKRVLKELSSRHSDLVHSLKTDITRNFLRFSVHGPSSTPPEAPDSSRKLPAQQPRRPTKTINIDKLLLSEPSRVRVFRKTIELQSGKPLYKTAKFKITQITDHILITDKGKVYCNNHIALKPYFRYIFSVGQNTIGDRLPASTSSSHSAVKRTATRSKPVMLEQRQENPSLSDPIVVDFKADSSSEGSSGSNHLQVVRESTPVEKRIKLHKDSPPTTFAHPTNSSAQPPNIDRTTSSPPTASAAQITGSGSADSRIEFLTPHCVSSEGLIQPSHDALSEPRSSYPSLSLPAQPVVEDSEAVRASSRSKEPTKFFGDPLRHSIRLVEEAQVSQSLIRGPTQDSPSGSAPSFLSSPRKPLVRDRPQIDIMEVSPASFADVNKILDTK